MFGKKPEPVHLVVEVSKADSQKPSENELRAQKFVLTDKNGDTRAQLQSAGKGAVALSFHDDDGKMGLLLGLDPNQSPTLAFVKDGKVRAGLELDKKSDQPKLTLSGSGDSKIDLGYDGKDNACVNLHDANGKVRVGITLSAKGDAEIKIYDKNGYVTSQVRPG